MPTATKPKLTPDELLIRNTRMYEAKLRGDSSREIGEREGLHYGQVDRILRIFKTGKNGNAEPSANHKKPKPLSLALSLPITEKVATVKATVKYASKDGKLKSVKNSNPNGQSLSLIDAACIILQRSETAMHPKEIVAEVLAEKLWTGTGATPFATLWSQLLAEIKAAETRGPRTSRFRLVKPGIFGLTARGREWKPEN